MTDRYVRRCVQHPNEPVIDLAPTRGPERLACRLGHPCEFISRRAGNVITSAVPMWAVWDVVEGRRAAVVVGAVTTWDPWFLQRCEDSPRLAHRDRDGFTKAKREHAESALTWTKRLARMEM